MRIFTREVVNTGRQAEVDLLRGFTALLLVIVHVGLYLGNGIGTGLWTFCDMVGSEPAAPVLMVLMGISMVYSRHCDPKSMFRRGLRLFIGGYALNLFRSLLPHLIFGNIDVWASIDAFFVVDILQFAGLSFLLLALLKTLRLPNLLILGISIVMVIVDQFIMLPDILSWDSKLLTGIVNLFCPVTEWSCFPLLTWFVFPVFGLACGDLLRHCAKKKLLYGCLLPVGLCGVLLVYSRFYRLYPDYTAYYWGNNFYYMGLKNVLLTLLIACFALSFWFFAEKILPGFAKKPLCFLSRNLNLYFVISWLIISALIHAQAIFNWQLGTWATIGLMAAVILASVGLAELWSSAKAALGKTCSGQNNSPARKTGSDCAAVPHSKMPGATAESKGNLRFHG